MMGRPDAATQAPASAPGPFYRAVWRWHFYAGLLVLPFLMLLALTGGLYLFKAELDGLAYRSIDRVEPQPVRTSPDLWTQVASTELGGAAVSASIPARPDRAVRIGVRRPAGAERMAFVDPYTARVTGSAPPGGVMETVKKLHSLTLVGPWANLLVEVVAGWAIVLVATGLYLWFPRGRDVAAFALRRGDPARRPFWRNLHAVTGLYAGAVILFLAVTGMPWSAFWGDQVMGAVREAGWGRPANPPAASPFGPAPHHEDAPQGVGWTMEGAVLHTGHETPGSLSTVVEAIQDAGMPPPYLVSIPTTPDLAWTVAYQGAGVKDARSLYVDGDSGAVLADLTWDQFGAGAKAFEWGIAVHQGLEYGWPNRIVMLLGCVAIWVLAISGGVMWWKRRPYSAGWRLAAPPAPPGLHARVAVLGIVLPLAVLYPLTGVTLAIALAVDRLAALFRGRMRRSPTALGAG